MQRFYNLHTTKVYDVAECVVVGKFDWCVVCTYTLLRMKATCDSFICVFVRDLRA